jgi:hypothetical protein
MFKLVELVEERIGQSMRKAGKGAIMHDGWSCNGVHYVGLIACFNNPLTSKHYGYKGSDSNVELCLLSCSPMQNSDSDDDSDDDDDIDESLHDYATNFTAETHIKYFEDMFLYYGCNLRDWAICQIADNCSVNKKIAVDLGIPHVGCKNHLLNLEVKRMTKNTDDLKETIESVHNTMLQCKTLKNSSLLRNLVNLRPILFNATRWSGKYHMLKRFTKIRDELVAVANNNATMQVNTSKNFRDKGCDVHESVGEDQ